MSATNTSTNTGSSIANLAATASTSKLSSTSAGASAVGFKSDEWLTLLTTELKYQDPSKPSDPTQFVAQLAQFSAVSQQVSTNSKLDTMNEKLSAGSLGQAASMIGRKVNAPVSSYVVPGSGSAPASTYDFKVSNPNLKNVHLQVANSNGTVVGTAAVSGGSGSVSFSGAASTGGTLPSGGYTLSLVGTDSSGATQTAGTLTTSGTVTQVLQDDGALQFRLDNGNVVNTADVTDLSA